MAVYLQNIFPNDFVDRILSISKVMYAHQFNMNAKRYSINDDQIVAKISEILSHHQPIKNIYKNIRLIYYPPGGFISPHYDAIQYDDEIGQKTTHSFVIYLHSMMRGEGDTNIYPSKNCHKVSEYFVPIKGSVLILPYGTWHDASNNSDKERIIIRGDLTIKN